MSLSDASARSLSSAPDADAEQAVSSRPTLVIEPPRGWRMLDIAELWRYRELLWVLTERDIRVRYKQTVLGSAWAIIQPFMLMVVFSIFFGGLAKMPSDGLPYPIFAFAALLPWTFFANSVSNSANALIGSSSLISKVYFPRLVVPFSSIGSGLIDFALATVILLLMMLWYGIGWTANLLMAPLLVAGVMLISLGVGVFLSAVTVAYRDFRYVVPFMVQFWMFATPVAYPASIVPAEWRWLLFLNPMAGYIEGFRSAFLDRRFDVVALSMSLAISLVVFAIGVAYFDKVERSFADVV